VNDSPAYTNVTGPTAKVQIFGEINSTYKSPVVSTDPNSEFEVGSTILFKGELRDDCQQNLSQANVTYELTANALETSRPITNSSSTGDSGFITNISKAFDGSLNETTTNVTIASNGTDTGNFSHLNLTFKINSSLEDATLFITISKNSIDLAGLVYIYNFSSGQFIPFATPLSTTPQTNVSVVSKTAGHINSSGHIIVFANSTGNSTTTNRNTTLYIFDTYLSSNVFFKCGPVTNATGNLYGCPFDTTGKTVSTYDVKMLGTKAFHNVNSTVNISSFKIKSSVVLEDAKVSVETDGWGIGVKRNFTVNVTDNTGDTVTVILWESADGGTYTQVANTTCTSCSDTLLVFNRSYLCSEKGTRQFKFNATDTEGNSDETKTSDSGDYADDDQFTVEEDSVRIELIAGNNTNATLHSSTIFKLRVFDLDNNTFNLSETATVTFNVTKQGIGSAFATVGTADTNGVGNANFSFTPDRTFGRFVQEWKGYIDEPGGASDCYLFNITESFNVTTLTNIPELKNETINPKSGGWGIERFFNVTVNDTHNNGTVYLWEASDLVSPSWIFLAQKDYNDTNTSVQLNFSINLTKRHGIGTFFFKFNSSNTLRNRNETEELNRNNFTVTKDTLRYENVSGNNSIANRSGSGVDVLSVRVFDTDNQTYVGNLNVTFSVTTDGSSFDSGFKNTTNTTGFVTYNMFSVCVIWVSKLKADCCIRN